MKEEGDSINSCGKVCSPVQRMFDGRSVLITGASGFIGRVLLEKLLYTYRGIERVYILLRAKRKQEPHERLDNLLKVPVFDRIRALKDGQELLDKLRVIPGDIAEPRLGISDSDIKRLLEDKSLSIVFHSAATIKFDAPLKTAIKLNLSATKEVIELCKNLPNLISLCHVSTAYVNGDILDESPIEEKLYPIDSCPERLIELAELLDEESLQILKPRLVGKRPNTYTYAKALAEHLIAEQASNLPVIIVRPSIVVAAWKEPVRGWIDNLNGPTGLMLATGRGLMRSLHANRNSKADVIPVDTVVNTMIASAYYVAKTKNKLDDESIGQIDRENTTKTYKINQLTNIKRQYQIIENVEFDLISTVANDKSSEESVATSKTIKKTVTKDFSDSNGFANGNLKMNAKNDNQQLKLEKRKAPPIIHCCSGDLNPITWGYMEDNVFPIIKRYPSSQMFRYPFGTFKSNKFHDYVMRIFAHYLPALIIDWFCTMMGKKQQLMKLYEKLHTAIDALSHFILQNYNFKSNNIRLIQEALTDEDKEVLYTDITQVEWRNFYKDYILGIRRYLLKEEDNTIPQARRLLTRAYYLEVALRSLLALVVFTGCMALTRRLKYLI